MNTILLDPIGDAKPPDGYHVVDNEVDFLRHAPGETPLLVKGVNLCDWAQTYYLARQIPVKVAHSPVREIQSALPHLSDEFARNLYEQLGEQAFAAIERPLTPKKLVNQLYPGKLWSDRPSREHAAEWLLWLYEKRPTPTIQSVLSPIAREWESSASEPEAALYRTMSQAKAEDLLEKWLHIYPDSNLVELGEFPFAVPTAIQTRARNEWRKQTVNSSGAFFLDVLTLPIPGNLKGIVAQETFNYLRKNPEQLNHSLYEVLEPYLSLAQQSDLSKQLPPDPPGPLPDDPLELLSWFRNDYLPFRRWQSRFGDENARQLADSYARAFGTWYLDRYPAALMGGPMRDLLSFRQLMEQQSKSGEVATLVAVLDGLHIDDARQLKRAIDSATTRLTTLQDDCVFSPLPTVTVFTKESMLKGVPPSRVEEVDFLGKVLPERMDPSTRVEHLVAGEIVIWRIMEPDKTYHGRNSYDSLSRDVESVLTNVAQKLADIVERVSPEVQLRIIIATDHGRLLSESPRELPIPTGMESHGRAAWGSSRTQFEESGYLIDGDIAYLHGQSFGLPNGVEEVAVMIGPAMFKMNDAKGGAERFPHGGLYPEEVIVPWMILERDWAQPQVEVSIQGSGAAGRAESALVQVLNMSDVPLTLRSLLVRVGGRETDHLAEQEVTVSPQSSKDFAVNFERWPTKAELGKMTAKAVFSLATGRSFESDAILKLESQEMYRQDNPLEDLGL